MKAPIEFWFDFSSPYAYIANEWVDALAARHGRTVRRHAILLGVTFAAAELRSPVGYPIKRDYVLRDFARSARAEGVPYVQPEPFPLATHNAARLFWWLQDTQGAEVAAAWTRCAFRALFTRGVRLDEPEALQALAVESGLQGSTARAVWSDPQWKDRLRLANEQALAAGVFGAPWFMIDGEPFWGNDRKPTIERWLAQGPF